MIPEVFCYQLLVTHLGFSKTFEDKLLLREESVLNYVVINCANKFVPQVFF